MKEENTKDEAQKEIDNLIFTQHQSLERLVKINEHLQVFVNELFGVRSEGDNETTNTVKSEFKGPLLRDLTVRVSNEISETEELLRQIQEFV